MPDLSKAELIRLAEEKLADAKLLLDNGRPGNAYYLAGYAIELLLKAAISARFQANTLPDPSWLKDVFQHNLEKLIKLAQFDDEIKHSSDADAEFKGRWDIVLEWKETSRYYARSRRDADALIAAIDDPLHGVFQWLKTKL
jgi:HEPN domain-containing protein